MTKRYKAAVLAVILGASVMMTACGGSSKNIDNDNITISQYEQVEVKGVTKTEVTDEMVENQIETVLNQNKTETEVKEDRPCQRGDTVYIDFVGKKDGKAFDGGSAENSPLELGSGTFIDGFEDQVIGHNKGETFDIDVTFPENYQAADLAGQPAVFTITINKIVTTEVPELTDDLVTIISDESTTAEEYRAEVKANLEKQAEEAYQSSLQTEAWNEVVDNTTVKELPEDRVKELEDTIHEYYKNLAEQNGMKYKKMITDALGYADEEAFDKEVTQTAEKSVTQSLIVEAIAAAENITVNKDDDSYKEHVEKLASRYGYESADEFLKTADEEQVNETILQDMVKEYVASKCKLATE